MTDRRYGVNKYGDGKLYGPSDARQALAWDVSIDWDEDGLFEVNEAGLLTSIDINRGRTRLLRPLGGGFEPVKTGTATITLKNRDGRFDAWNTNSPLFPNVDDGKDIRIRVRDMFTGIRYPLFRGVITKIRQSGMARDSRVTITCSDGLEYLRNLPARVAMQLGITPNEAIGLILDDVNWPSRWGRNLDVTSDTIPYWWASGNKKSMSEIEDLTQSFLGYFFVDANGKVRFVKRDSVTEAVVSYSQEYLLKDVDNPQPYEIRRNITRLKVHPRMQAATSTIYQLAGTPPFVLPGAANSQKFFANYTYNNQTVPARNVAISVFEANTQSDFLGTDETASCTANLTDFGDTGFVEVINNSGGLVYIRIELEGDAIYEPNASDVTYPSDLSTVRSPRELVIDLKWQQDINVATDISTVMGPFFATPHPMPNVKIDNRPELQFITDLFDITSADIDELGLNGVSFRVGGIQHKSDTAFENCQRVISRIYLEPYISANAFMQWDTASVWDTSTIFGY
jgi:hypothetical protein